MRYEEYIKKMIRDLNDAEGEKQGEYPDIDLYIDQAAMLLNQQSQIYKKDEKEQIFTKSMISNYAKHNIIPRPVNKKYTKDHLILLHIVRYLKGMFQMNEIEMLMKPLIDNYNSVFDEKIDLEILMQGVIELREGESRSLEDHIGENIKAIKTGLKNTEQSDDDILEIFLVIISLAISADSYRYVAEKLLHEYFVQPSQEKPVKLQKEKPAKTQKEKQAKSQEETPV